MCRSRIGSLDSFMLGIVDVSCTPLGQYQDFSYADGAVRYHVTFREVVFTYGRAEI